jgi:hypothetical protein
VIRQTCKSCGRPDKFNWKVPDAVWAAVVPPSLRSLVLCLSCFDKFATERDIVYARFLTGVLFEPVRVVEAVPT